jgi:hypothetical protein
VGCVSPCANWQAHFNWYEAAGSDIDRVQQSLEQTSAGYQLVVCVVFQFKPDADSICAKHERRNCYFICLKL